MSYRRFSRVSVLALVSGIFLCAQNAGPGTEMAGHYRGEWMGAAGSGTFRLGLEPAAGGTWKCDVTFTLNGEELKTMVRQCDVKESKLDAVYDFDAQGLALRSHTTGQWKAGKFDGTYRTTTTDGSTEVDQGTWLAARE